MQALGSKCSHPQTKNRQSGRRWERTSTHLAFPTSAISKTQQNTSTFSESTDGKLSHALPQPRPRVKEWALKWDIKIHVFETECIRTFQCLISVKGHFALLDYNVLFSLPSEIQDFHLRLPSVTIVLGYKKRKLKNCGNINCFIQTQNFVAR